MEQIRQNYYGNLCTEMYEILHREAPSDELDFYLSYAEKGKKILEPMASVACRDILQYSSDRLFDYIFISSSSVSLFTDISVCRQLLGKMKSLLSPDGVFVFAVDTIANRCIDDTEYVPSVTVPFEDGTASLYLWGNGRIPKRSRIFGDQNLLFLSKRNCGRRSV